MRPVFTWNLGNRSLELGKRTLVMGILNVTPNSFSDGGQFFERDRAVEHGLRLLSAGADIVDGRGRVWRCVRRGRAWGSRERSRRVREPLSWGQKPMPLPSKQLALLRRRRP